MKNGPIAILGATSGVAQSLARQMASSDTTFILVARNETKLRAVAADLTARGSVVTTVVANLADIDSHPDLLTTLKNAEHHFLFHSTLTDQTAAQSDWSAAAECLTTNLVSPLSLLHGLANQLESRGGGSLVVVSSVAGDRGRGSNYWYGTAKGGLSIHCQGLRNRLAKSGVHVLTVKPGFIDTAMTAHLPKTPAILWATPEKVATLIVKGWKKDKNVIYTPGFGRAILWVITSIPETIFKRLSL